MHREGKEQYRLHRDSESTACPQAVRGGGQDVTVRRFLIVRRFSENVLSLGQTFGEFTHTCSLVC